MVFRAWDHQKTHEHIDFMLINGLIIIYHRFVDRKSFNLFCLRRQQFSYFCLQRQKSMFFWVFRLQNQNIFFFLVAPTALGPSLKDRARNLVQIPLKISFIGPLSVELWRFEVGNRISVPMLYITLHQILHSSFLINTISIKYCILPS